MAKRRKLEAPSAGDLDQVEAEFRRETRRDTTPVAPIAQIAGEAAKMHEPLPPGAREAQAVASEFRKAVDEGRLILDIAVAAIDADAVLRDRTRMPREELDELKDSIAKNGVRLPIEVFPLPNPDGAFEYGLISGYRRLLATRELQAQMGGDAFSSIKAIVREARSSADHFAAVAEENEVRSSLCHYERGRYAALTCAHGVFSDVDAADEALFPFASKAKRSKIRSFALVFEELGDLLVFPEALTEKQGLKLSSALKAGIVSQLRDALAHASPASAAEEWKTLEEAVARVSGAGTVRGQGGRPKKPVLQHIAKTRSGADVTVTLREQSPDRWTLDLTGATLQDSEKADLLEQVVAWISKNLTS